MKFVVPGNPVGYYAVGKRPNWTRHKKYIVFKERVQWHAKYAGLSIPLMASKEKPLFIKTVAYFKSGAHCDPGNVQKGVVDALFYGKRKGTADKYTGGAFDPPRYDKENPRVEIEVSEWAANEQ